MRTPVFEAGPAPLGRDCLGDDAVGHLAEYWFQLADAAGGVPLRSSFDPAKVVQLLPRLVVAEHLGGHDFRYRLLGTEVDSFTRGGYTGKRTSEIQGHGPGNRIHDVFVATLESGRPHAMAMPYVGSSRFCRSVRQLSLPFRTETGADQIISLIDFDLRPGVVPAMLTPAERKLL
jgi:hypothetical protein